MPQHGFIAMTLLDFGSRKSAGEAEQYFGFQAISGNYNPEGTNLMDTPGAPGWPLIPDMSIYFTDAPATSMTYADALCRFAMPAHSPYTFDALYCTDDRRSRNRRNLRFGYVDSDPCL
jgi:hypothetical protein